MPTAEKISLVEELTKELGASKGVYLADFSGLTVEKITTLRRAFRKSGTRFVVSKNTLAKLAVKGTPMEPLTEKMRGNTGIAYSQADPVAPAKVLADFLKDNEGFTIKGAYVDGSILDGKQVGEIAKLPPKEVLVAQALGIIQSPMRGIVTCVNGVLTGLVVALEEIRKKKEAAGG
jgi:large subunit ribosomal protein L10